MDKNYAEVNVQKTKTDITLDAEPVPAPMPVDESVPVKPTTKRRRTVVPSLADNDATNTASAKKKQAPPVINIEEVKEDDKELKESINRVMDNMKEQIGLPTPLDSVVNRQQINAWKQEFGEVFRTDLNGQVYVWHKLRRKDYIEVMSDKSFSDYNDDVRIFLRQEAILRKAALFPTGEELDNIINNNAGVAGNISDEIMLASGFRAVRSEKI